MTDNAREETWLSRTEGAMNRIRTLEAALSEAVGIISIMADMEPHLGVEPSGDDDQYTLYTSEKRQAHDITGDDIRRARAFIKENTPMLPLPPTPNTDGQ